ncbi:MAG TPA: ABC transporter permease [Opitutaceae bacterium]|nr:ABC transporter permease [Opitutaceae bacterium]
MNHLLQDLRFAFRLMTRTPGFAFAAILVLALGVGANTAVFSLVDELLWSPRPFAHADEIVQVYSQDRKHPSSFRLFSYPTYRDIADQNAVFSGVLAYNLTMIGIGEAETSRRAFGSVVSSNYFSVLGVPLRQGRAFTPGEETPSRHVPVVIASYRYWQSTGFDPGLVGRTIRVNERAFTVVGIAPARFTGTMMLLGPELYFPLGVYDLLANDFFRESGTPTLDRRDSNQLFVIGRLKPGVTVAGAEPALRTLALNLEKAFPVEQKEQTFFARPLPRLSAGVAPPTKAGLTVLGSLLIGMAAIVLLIACLNLANLLLARGVARRREIAIRLALGGGRRRILRQLLTEGAVLALLGGVVGWVLALGGTRLLMDSLSSRIPFALSFEGVANPEVFLAALGFCAVATIGFALGPALRLSRIAGTEDLKAQPGQDPATRRRRRWVPRHPLLVAQIALSLGLLCAGGLFLRGALKAAKVDTGFRSPQTLLAELDASLAGYDETRTLQAYRAIEERIAALPGVQAASVASIVPFGTVSQSKNVRRAGLRIEPGARPATAAEGRSFNARWTSIGADYFRTMGLPILRGRAFSAFETDQTGAPRVAIVDETLARDLYPEGNALGQHIQFADAGGTVDSSAAASMEIVGIVPDTRWDFFSAGRGGTIYVPYAQGFLRNAFLHVRPAVETPAAAAALVETIRREIRTAAPGVPLFTIKTYARHLDSSLQLWVIRTGAVLFGVLGGLALLLAVVGVYGVRSYTVSRRTREIGVRLALGATPQAVQGMILREGIAMTVAGLAAGLLLGMALGQAVAGMLYEVSAFDPFTFSVAPAVLVAAALLACWLPARRATGVAPMVALRAE